jgi:hypothetical protein
MTELHHAELSPICTSKQPAGRSMYHIGKSVLFRWVMLIRSVCSFLADLPHSPHFSLNRYHPFWREIRN